MARVYRARHRRLNRVVALKLVRSDDRGSAEAVRRLRNEAETVALLDHPNIVPVYDVGEQRGQVYLAMKLVDGTSLAAQLQSFAADPKSAARLVAAVARAVHHAHQRGVLHRDLKPANILLDGDGKPHVTDFGLARWLEVDSGLTQTGALVGTPSYMAPEQTRGHKGAVTTATDVHGLGAVLYTLLSGTPPFRGDTILETLDQVREREPEPPRRSNARVDRDLETICLKCLAKDPCRRYESAQALAEDLERWLAGEPIRARRAGVGEWLRKWVRRHPALAALVFVMSLALVGFVAGLLWHNRQLQEAAERERLRAEEARIQREQAEATVRSAMYGLRELLYRTRAKDLAQLPGIEKVRAQLAARALQLLESFVKEEGTDPPSRLRKGLAYRQMAGIYDYQDSRARAEQAFRQAVTFLEQLANDCPEVALYWHEAALAQHDLAYYLHLTGSPEASEQFRQTKDKYAHAVELGTDIRACGDYAWFLATCPDVTLRDKGKAVVLAQVAATTNKDRAAAWTTLGVTHYQAGSWSEAVQAFERSLTLKDQNENDDFFFLAMAHWQLGNKEQARHWYDKTAQWMENYNLLNGDDHGFRREAEALLGIKDKPKGKKEEPPRNDAK
jgi:tetratricopeptide (TPR) repeat protein